jgi:hypothetical protein
MDGVKLAFSREKYQIGRPFLLAPFGGFRYGEGFLVTERGDVCLNRRDYLSLSG